jgi:hypothetical protein
MMGLGILEPLPSAGPGDALTVEEDQPRTRIILMPRSPYGETPICNGPDVD